LRELWKQYDQQIQQANILNLQSWVLQMQTFEYLQTSKAKSKLQAVSRFKQWVIVLGILWVLFLAFLFVNSLSWSKVFFAFSVGAILAFNIYAVVLYIRHTLLIHAIDNSESLMDVQQKIAELKASTLQGTRVLFLQTPFYATFFWNSYWMRESPMSFWLIAVPVALLFCVLSIWLYKSIRPENAGKKWFRLLFSGREWTSVIKAGEYLREIEAYRKNAQ